MRLVDQHVLTSHRSLELNPNLRRLAATQAICTAASDLCYCAIRAGHVGDKTISFLRKCCAKMLTRYLILEEHVIQPESYVT